MLSAEKSVGATDSVQAMKETYCILNVQSEDYAALLNDTDRSEIVNINDKTKRGSEWFITHIKKDEYWIQNADTQSFACYDNRPDAGGQVLGKWAQQDAKPSGSVWRIRSTPGSVACYTISPLENPDIFWRCEGEGEGTPLELGLPWTARHCQWVFKPARTDAPPSPIVRYGATDGHMYITQRLLENLPNEEEDVLDLVFEIAKTIHEIAKLPGVDWNLDAGEQRIVVTAAQLITTLNTLTESKSTRKEDGPWLDQLKSVLKVEFANLYRFKRESGQVPDLEDEKRGIAEIFERVNEARLQFELGINVKTFKNTYEIKEHLRTFIFDRLKPSRKANHKYDLEGDEAKLLRRSVCTPGTRVDLLDAIITWVKDTSPNSHDVYWLFGLAGSGKSTIAYTIARRFESNSDSESTVILGGNFFCSRQFEETKQSKSIIRTIAYQLSLVCRPFADALRESGTFEAIDHDVQAQIQGLLVKPWQESERGRVSDPSSPHRYLVVIDALDEIEGGGGSKFLGHLFAVLNKSQLNGLKFFATSRPDPGLVDQVDSFERERRHRYRLEDVDRKAVSADIRTYLTAELPHFANREEMETLVTSANGLFIYAATVVRHLDGHGRFEQELVLKRLLSVDGSYLDGLYSQILAEMFNNVGQDFYERRLQILHTFLCTPERTSATVAAELACHPNERDIYIETAADVVNRLHAVLYTENGQVLSYHKSFSDYLSSKDRSLKFWYDQAVLQRRLTESCFRLMGAGLKFNIADIPSSFTLDHDSHTLSADIQRNISASLGYSCRNWAHHLHSIGSTESDLILRLLLEFVRLRALFWIEAMNLLGFGGACDSMLRMASDCARTFDPVLANGLTEAANFAVYFSGSSASMSTPHLYISALATWPMKSNPCHGWRASFVGLPAFNNAVGGRSLTILNLTLESEVNSVGFSGDGTQLVSGSSDGLVRVWDASTGKELKVLRGHTGRVNSVVYSNDDTRIVSGSDDRSLRVWDALTGKELKMLQGHNDAVYSAAFSKDNIRIVSSSGDDTIRVWDASLGTELNVLKGHTDVVFSVAFSTDGTRIVSGSYDNSVRVWDTSTGKELKMLKGRPGPVRSVAFSTDGMRIVSGSDTPSVRVWDAWTGRVLAELKGHTDRVSSVAFSPDDMRIASGSFDGSVLVCDTSTGRVLKELKGHTHRVGSAAFSNDGARLVSGSDDRSVRVWDTNSLTDSPTGNMPREKNGLRNWLRSIADRSYISRVISGSDDHSMRVWDEGVSTGAELNGHIRKVNSVAFSADGSRIASGSDDQSVRVWDASTGHEIKVLKGHIAPVISVAFSPDGTRIVSGASELLMRLWDASTGRVLKKMKGHTHAVNSVAFSTDGQHIVSGSYDSTVRVWDTSTGKGLKVLQGHTSIIYSVTFSTDGMRVVSGSYDHSVRVWDTLTGTALKVLDGHTDLVNSVAFSTDGMRIVSGSHDQSVRVWDVSTGKALKVLEGHTSRVISATFSTDGTRILSSAYDGSVRLWDALTSKMIKEPNARTDRVNSVQFSTDRINSAAFSTDGKRVVFGALDGSVRVWDLSIEPRYLQECHVDADGERNHTGWLLSPSGEGYLMFVPLDARLPDTCNTLTMSRTISSSVHFTGAKLGTQWHECYRP